MAAENSPLDQQMGQSAFQRIIFSNPTYDVIASHNPN